MNMHNWCENIWLLWNYVCDWLENLQIVVRIPDWCAKYTIGVENHDWCGNARLVWKYTIGVEIHMFWSSIGMMSFKPLLTLSVAWLQGMHEIFVSAIEEVAATHIQAAYRGYKARYSARQEQEPQSGVADDDRDAYQVRVLRQSKSSRAIVSSLQL